MNWNRTIFILLWLPLAGMAQDQNVFYNRGQDVYVQEKGLIEVQGGLINDTQNGSGSIQNDGTIELTGDFENKRGAEFKVYDNAGSKERVLKFIGNGTQAIKGEMSTPGHSSFYNLVVDKASASDTVEMQTPVVVEGSLVFGSANITSTYNPSDFYTNNNHKGLFKTFDHSSNEFLLDIQNGNPDAISGYPVLEIDGAPATGFILTKGTRASEDGGVERKISSATSYLFPIGTEAKGFNGVRLNFTEIPGGGSVKAKFCDGSSNPMGFVGQLSSFCSGCDANNPPDNGGYNHYFDSNPCNDGTPQWVIFDHSAQNHGYWSFASTNTGYHYDMEVFPNSFPDDVNNRNSSWRVIKHEADYGADPSLASVDWTPEIESLVSDISDLTTFTRNMGCYSGDGVPGGSYTDFSHFTMGMARSGSALPVKLLFVKADPMGKHRIRVSWATSLEINNSGFEVHRSTDGVNFSKVGWVDGHDNSTVTQTYSFEDRVLDDNQIYYYKLKQIDNDQQFEYSYVVQAKLAGGESVFNLYPNPTTSNVFIDVKNPAGEITVRMYDLKGAMVYENYFPVEQEGTTQTVAVKASSVLPSGTYLLTATSNGANFSSKVVLQ